MAFVDYEYFKNLYGADAIDSALFNRLEWNAEKMVCNAVTGVDGICKLKVAFPTIEDDIESVKRCICNVAFLMAKIEKANYESENGKVVSSITAGNESISYSVNGGLIGAVLSDKKAQNKLFMDTINNDLQNVKDNNGVRLLYLGIYPYLIRY